jgi:hypothetical protein
MTLPSRVLASLPERRRNSRRRAGLLLAFAALAGMAGARSLYGGPSLLAFAIALTALTGTALVLLAE